MKPMSCLKNKRTLRLIVWSFTFLWVFSTLGVSQAQTLPPIAVAPLDRATIPPNNVPVAVDDTLAVTPFGQAVDAMVLANDHDGDGGIDPIVINSFDATSANGGTVTQTGNALRYTPASGFSGGDSFTYTISDGFSVSSAATVSVRVNTPPVAADDTGFTAPNTPVALAVLANDNDGDGGIDAVAIDGFDATSASGGTVTLSGANLAYTPATGFTGNDTFTYTISDGFDVGGSATVTVTVVDGPAANHDQAATAVNVPVTVNALANDVAGSGATLDAASLDLDPGQGGQQSSVSQPGVGTFTSDGSGNVSFTPVSGFAGTASVSYTVNDSLGTPSNPATITIQVVDTPTSFLPPVGTLTANPANLPEIEWRIVWINGGNTQAHAIRATVDIPAGTTLVAGSLTCEPAGVSTVDLCTTSPLGGSGAAPTATGIQVLYQGMLGADASDATEETAANEIVITYRVTTALGFSGTLQAQAAAHWDEDGDGDIDDEIANAQSPALSDDPATPTPNDPTVVVIPVATGACLFQMRHASVGQTGNKTDDGSEEDAGQGDGVSQGAMLDTRAADDPLTLTTPQPNQVVAGTSVAVAALQGPGEGTTISAPVPVTVANVTPQIVPDIIETDGTKMELIPAAQDRVVVTASGVLISIPNNALAVEDTLEIGEVDVTKAPGPLPGEGLARVYNIALTSGQSQFASPLSLRIPYDDADQNGIVDGTTLVLETELTPWRYDAAQGMWVQLPEALVIPDANATIARTDQGGLIGLFRAANGQAVTLGTMTDDVVIPATGGSIDNVMTVGNAAWETVGIAAVSPFVKAWDTTQHMDGLYELRAICSANPSVLDDFITEAPADAESGGGGGGCFIATAAYGSALAPQIQALRDFRDTYMLPNTIGHWLVDQYYRLSPPVADVIRTRGWLRAVVRIGLTPIVWSVQGWMYGPRLPLLLTWAGMLAAAGLGVVHLRRRRMI